MGPPRLQLHVITPPRVTMGQDKKVVVGESIWVDGPHSCCVFDDSSVN